MTNIISAKIIRLTILNRLVFFLLIVITSCDDNQKKEQELKSKSSEVVSSEKISNSIGELLIPEAQKLTNNWQEYTVMEELISEYYNIDPVAAINNAENLANAAQQLKDSIRVEKFDTPDIKIRLNVLYNNALNLSSISTLPNKNNELLKSEIINILDSFSAVNSKINNLIKQEILEKELNDFNN